MPTITADRLIVLLEQFVKTTGQPIDLLLVGALALQCYGFRDRFTNDVDGELAGPLHPLLTFLANEGIPADLTQDISKWSIIAMLPGYRDRATDLLSHPNLRIRLLTPVDFVIAKLRRGIELDLDDALYVVRRFQIPKSAIEQAAADPIAASPQDTTIFLFQKTVELFCRSLLEPTLQQAAEKLDCCAIRHDPLTCPVGVRRARRMRKKATFLPAQPRRQDAPCPRQGRLSACGHAQAGNERRGEAYPFLPSHPEPAETGSVPMAVR